MMKRDVNRLVRGHRANLERYSRMLATTNLTEIERQYIHRRIAEEWRAITKLEAEQVLPKLIASADPSALTAARGGVEAARQ